MYRRFSLGAMAPPDVVKWYSCLKFRNYIVKSRSSIVFFKSISRVKVSSQTMARLVSGLEIPRCISFHSCLVLIIIKSIPQCILRF